MLVFTKNHYKPKRNGHGYDFYISYALCGNCGEELGKCESLENVSPINQKKMFNFTDGSDKHRWFVCPFCGEKLYPHKYISYKNKVLDTQEDNPS